MKYCKDCKFHIAQMCYHPKMMEEDLVNGPRESECRDNRHHARGLCGREAFYFVPSVVKNSKGA